jgi:hypothetical protein
MIRFQNILEMLDPDPYLYNEFGSATRPETASLSLGIVSSAYRKTDPNDYPEK